MNCPSCHSDTPDSSKFCISCGAALPARCPSCGSANPPAAKFCLECGQKLSASKQEAPAKAATTSMASPTSHTEGAAERRQLTVMFVDLVGSTSLSARLDPEDMREIIGAYHRCCAEQITKADGFVAKYMGDGVLAYFGYPHAHEDDAERAVRSALALIEAVPKLRAGHDAVLAVRVGIATGLVVVGDLIGEGDAQERGVVGDTPNLAARLQALADPGQVVISNSTRRLAGGMFDYRDLGRATLKGLGDPVQAWLVMRSSRIESRFEALHETKLTALVGREEELELLLRRWQRAKSGEGQVVLLSGEPGIGKSRLTVALQERFIEEPHTRLRYFCSPQHTDRALYPTIGQLERAAGLTHDDTPQIKLGKLDRLLAQTATPIGDAALFAEMLSLPNDGRYPALDLAPEQRREKTLQALTLQLERLTRSVPVLMVFEDAHWIDPTSLEVLDRVVDRAQALPLLMIVTFRPEFDAAWIGRPYVTMLTINRLARRDIEAMIDRTASNRPMPADIRQDIIERADGIPLFVEEMTKAVLEAESEGEARRTASAISYSPVTVPASLHASLMARLDRLGPAKEVAQIGSAIGREFSHALLSAVVRKPEVELGAALERLVQAGLLFRHGVPPHANYLFKHALVQDAAYGTLLRGPRRALHAQIADTLEREFAEIAENQPEMIARHCTEAGLIEKAAMLWGKAGQRSLEHSALVEAAEQLGRALDQIAAVPGTAALRREQIKLQVALINTQFHVKGYAAPETKAVVERARLLIEQVKALGEEPQDPLVLFSVLFGIWVNSFIAFNGGVIRELAMRMLMVAEEQGAKAQLVIGHRIMGTTLASLGDIPGGRAHLDRAIALYIPTEHRPLATRFGTDARATSLIFRAFVLWLLGYPDAARADTRQALDEAREIGQTATLMFVLALTSHTLILCGNYATATALLDELIVLADGKGILLRKAEGITHRGGLLALTGNASDAVRMLISGIEGWRSTGATIWTPLFFSYLARAYAELGRFDEAQRSIGEAISVVETTKETWCEADVQRTAGEIALNSPDRDVVKAEAHFERALAVAREQQAKSWELRASTSLARLWRDQGKRTEARDLLAPIYGWFTEGFDTPDLKEAKALLTQFN